MRPLRVVVVGAGMGGLAAAVDLARGGCDVTLLERAATPGGKMREVMVAGAPIDAGPTVLTMRFVFDHLFADAGQSLDNYLTLRPAHILARHAWSKGGRLDLFADAEQSAAAIGELCGAADARAYLAFAARSAALFRALWAPFMAAQRPSPWRLVRSIGWPGLMTLLRAAPLRTLHAELARTFADARLRQLFGRYATYVGSSPYAAPATLMLIAHAEQRGVWLVSGGMQRLADSLCRLAVSLGAQVRYGAEVTKIIVRHGRAAGVMLADGETIEADAVLFNGESAMLTHLLAPSRSPAPRAGRSLSAITWCLRARADGFPLTRHNVFFATDYDAEFRAIFHEQAVPAAPTVYVCAQDRENSEQVTGAERLLVLINAPADGERQNFDAALYWPRARGVLAACGLHLLPEHAQATTPGDFARLFPASGGALYGEASHGAWASFRRPGAATWVSGLYCAGGSVHPGAGLPMATLSGRLAATRLLADAGGHIS